MNKHPRARRLTKSELENLKRAALESRDEEGECSESNKIRWAVAGLRGWINGMVRAGDGVNLISIEELQEIIKAIKGEGNKEEHPA